MRIVVGLALAILAAGCQTAEQRAANDDAFCRSIGAQPGTPVYVECRMRRDDQFQATRRAILASGTVCNRVGTAVVCN